MLEQLITPAAALQSRRSKGAKGPFKPSAAPLGRFFHGGWAAQWVDGGIARWIKWNGWKRRAYVREGRMGWGKIHSRMHRDEPTTGRKGRYDEEGRHRPLGRRFILLDPRSRNPRSSYAIEEIIGRRINSECQYVREFSTKAPSLGSTVCSDFRPAISKDQARMSLFVGLFEYPLARYQPPPPPRQSANTALKSR
jgi:hypothetical protein